MYEDFQHYEQLSEIFSSPKFLQLLKEYEANLAIDPLRVKRRHAKALAGIFENSPVVDWMFNLEWTTKPVKKQTLLVNFTDPILSKLCHEIALAVEKFDAPQITSETSNQHTPKVIVAFGLLSDEQEEEIASMVIQGSALLALGSHNGFAGIEAIYTSINNQSAARKFIEDTDAGVLEWMRDDLRRRLFLQQMRAITDATYFSLKRNPKCGSVKLPATLTSKHFYFNGFIQKGNAVNGTWITRRETQVSDSRWIESEADHVILEFGNGQLVRMVQLIVNSQGEHYTTSSRKNIPTGGLIEDIRPVPTWPGQYSFSVLNEFDPVKGPLNFKVGIGRLKKASNTLEVLQVFDSPKIAQKVEKNWGVFRHKNTTYLIKNIVPFELAKFTNHSAVITVDNAKLKGAGAKAINLLNKVGYISQSSNPVKFDGEYYHLIKIKIKNHYAYFIMNFMLEDNGLIIKRVSRRPIFAGEKLFIVSLHIEKGKLVVTGGLLDKQIIQLNVSLNDVF